MTWENNTLRDTRETPVSVGIALRMRIELKKNRCCRHEDINVLYDLPFSQN
jgi:hypothetical protein